MPRQHRRRAPGWWYPWTFVGGMLLVIVVNGVMISYALGTFPGLSTEDAYRRGLAYNQTIAAADAGQGRYATELELPMPGQWDARLLARRGDAEYQLSRRIIVP